MNEKIIVLQDGTIFNGRNIISIFYRRFNNDLFKIYIQDVSENHTEIYCGNKVECQNYLHRLSVMLGKSDSVIWLEDVYLSIKKGGASRV